MSVGNVKAYCRPGYEKVLSAPWVLTRKRVPRPENEEERKWQDYCAEKLLMVHKRTRVAKKDATGKLAGLIMHAAIRQYRVAHVDIDAIEKARKAGVRMEKPLAVIYLPDSPDRPDKSNNPIHVFKWIRGKTLVDFLKKEKSPSKRKRVISDVFRQVEKLHASGLTHGDLRGRNVIVDRSGKAHLIDMTSRYAGYKPADDFLEFDADLHDEEVKGKLKLLREGEWPIRKTARQCAEKQSGGSEIRTQVTRSRTW